MSELRRCTCGRQSAIGMPAKATSTRGNAHEPGHCESYEKNLFRQRNYTPGAPAESAISRPKQVLVWCGPNADALFSGVIGKYFLTRGFHIDVDLALNVPALVQ